MARKGLPPGFLKRGGKGKGPIPPAPKGKNGKNAKGVAKGAPLPSPPPRRRVTPGMQAPEQVPIMRAPAALVVRGAPPPPEETDEGAPPQMGPAMAAGVGGSPMRRRVAQAMRGGRMAF